MQPKWRAPACYLGVAALCVIYLVLVPGVHFIDVCAGAGLGASIMWAINEWETGKWNAPVAAPMMPAQTAPVLQPTAPRRPAPAVQKDAAPEVPRRLGGHEPDWDTSALAETWARLQGERAIEPGETRAAFDAPRTARPAGGAAANNVMPANETSAPRRPVEPASVGPAGVNDDEPPASVPAEGKAAPAEPDVAARIAAARARIFAATATSSTAASPRTDVEASPARSAEPAPAEPIPAVLRPGIGRPR